MMQSVNFYFDEYRPKPLTFDTRFAGLALAVTGVMLIAFGMVKSSHLTTQNEILVKKQADLTKLQADQAEIIKQMQSAEGAANIDELIANEQKSLTSYRKILANMQQPDSAVVTPFSQIMKQLGEQKTRSVWLTEINISAQSLSLKGSSTRSEAIPQYVELLKESSALKRQFDELKVERDQNDKRVVNFILSNGRLSKDG